jgi:formylglycine-generating enzyme required for sulfatase activity
MKTMDTKQGGIQIYGKYLISLILTLPLFVILCACSFHVLESEGYIDKVKLNQIDQQLIVLVPSGEFIMGSDEENEIPPHNYQKEERVTLGAFWIYQTEVTNRQFVKFLNSDVIHEWMGKSPNDVPIYEDNGVWFVKDGFENFPVHFVNFEAAENYCRWAGGRLPTNAEWEKAARGPEGRLYPWGDNVENVCDLANSSSCFAGLVEVGSFPKGASPYGVLNMAGNVMEWVDGWWNEGREVRGAKGTAPFSPLVPMYVQTGYFGPPGNWFEYVGFRCVVDIDQ